MRNYKSLFENSEIENFFYKRTNNHINLVRKYIKKILNSNIINELNKDILKNEYKNHDASKLKFPELKPYIYITWNYKCKADGINFKLNQKQKDWMNKASEHHVKNNKHHPECWCDIKVNLINKDNRDKLPEEIINSTKMSKEYIACMVSDWMAMSEELKNDPFEWAENNINIKWKFNDEQKKFIYKILNEIWNGKL